MAQATNAHTQQHSRHEPAPVTGKVVEDIVARVNDQIITQSDYDRAARTARQPRASSRLFLPASWRSAQADLLRDLIDQQLLLSKGKELGITGETELVKRLDDIRKQNHLDSMEDLEKAAQQQGVSYEDFKANIRNGIITQQVVRDEVGRHISMSPSDVQKYFKAHESEFAQPESVNSERDYDSQPRQRGHRRRRIGRGRGSAGASRRDRSETEGGGKVRGLGQGRFDRAQCGERQSRWGSFAAACWPRKLKIRPSP